jgi:hypothetical protein
MYGIQERGHAPRSSHQKAHPKKEARADRQTKPPVRIRAREVGLGLKMIEMVGFF